MGVPIWHLAKMSIFWMNVALAAEKAEGEAAEAARPKRHNND
jgi:hypothetical protein